MLSEYKNIYEKNIFNKELKQKDKNELIRLYVETNDEKYLSAAIYKFWYILNNKIANNKTNKFIEPEDFYNMYIDSILETCKNRLWEKESHNLYNDKKAPEKSINTIFNSKIINYFHACNRQKRKLSFEKISLSTNDYWNQNILNKSIEEPNMTYIVLLVNELFNKKDYYSAYIVDFIINNNLFDYKNGELTLNKKKLKHYIMNIDENYLNYFSDYYKIDMEKVLFSYKYFKDISYTNADKKIDASLITLSHNKTLKNALNFYGENNGI